MNNKKKKGKKKEKEIKTEDDRFLEISVIKDKIKQLGLGEGNPDILKFNQILDKYVKDGETTEGKIRLLGHNRIIDYLLPSLKKNKCQVSLLYDKNV